MRNSTLLAAVGLSLTPLSANAGGMGVITLAGLHEGRAPYYRDDGEQGIDVQYRPNAGFGLEGMLGDKDDKIQGVARLFLLSDWPLLEPDTSGEDDSFEYEHPPHEDQPIRHQGAVMVGVQWGLYGDPGGLQLTATTLAGSGFATMDNLEFFMVEPGIGATYMLGERLQAHANVAASVRYRKRAYLGGNAYAGLRYMFD